MGWIVCGTSSPINGGGTPPPIKRMMQLDPAQYALLRQTRTSPSGGLVCVILDHSPFQSTDCDKLGFVVRKTTGHKQMMMTIGGFRIYF